MEESIVLLEGMALSRVSRGGRQAFDRDALQAQLVRGTWRGPSAAEGWVSVKAGANGEFSGRELAGAYLAFTVASSSDQTLLLAASGHGIAYVNGEPHSGDTYSYNRLAFPVRLKKGNNTLLFTVARGRFSGKLSAPTAPLAFNTSELTVPDFILGEREPLWASVVLVNSQDRATGALSVLAETAGGGKQTTKVPSLPPRSVRKIAVQILPPGAPAGPNTEVTLGVADQKATLTLRNRKPTEVHKRTFISKIDDSVQYYAVNPAQRNYADNILVLSLHGASVEAQGQAEAYGSYPDITTVAATNRRPYGFDWEDWGRLDAFEVLAEAKKRYPHDPQRVHLTGHSMGGHGTWSVGSLFPGQFGTIGPSAGWISFNTYGGANRPTDESPVAALFSRAANQYDTLLFKENLRQCVIYVLHGDADDNVPVAQARQMRTVLAEMKHPRVLWHEEPGAGHWWDNGPEPGAACVDWAPLRGLFHGSERVKIADNAALVTVNPAVSSSNAWLTIEQQEKALSPSSANLSYLDQKKTVEGTTQNIQKLTLDLTERAPFTRLVYLEKVTLDGQTLRVPSNRVTLEKRGGRWSVGKAVSANEKNPQRSGPLKQAFTQRFVLVYGTVGSAEENAWGYAKARYDAEQFLYRGNGAPLVLSDREYDSKAMKDRSVILYGNADTNALFKALLGKCPIQVRRGGLTVAGREKRGEELASLFVYPKPGSATALVGVVGGTGLVGCRLTERVPYFVSGTAFPDWLVASPSVLTDGMSGVVAAGFFGNDWHVESGESAWS